ncbi:hypothetical protein K402DRAFT_222256 [Aulographum hederae CBS 113979]|uniref:Uncharacterized protein n=1 Tax=Aulographum hederae CBS 113979 TaxID=1176131 RepID=A0A6G1GLB9_9PEZI|nr:hypothetical protein K402DRAFT_222256 [Aulographum hederae CBS 113979]
MMRTNKVWVCKIKHLDKSVSIKSEASRQLRALGRQYGCHMALALSSSRPFSPGLGVARPNVRVSSPSRSLSFCPNLLSLSNNFKCSSFDHVSLDSCIPSFHSGLLFSRVNTFSCEVVCPRNLASKLLDGIPNVFRRPPITKTLPKRFLETQSPHYVP